MTQRSRSPFFVPHRRRFLQQTALSGAMALTMGRLAGARANAAEINPYPMGTKPVADNIEGAVKFWLDAMKDAAPDNSADVVLTAGEIAELKSMKPKVGHTWYGFFVPAIEGWNRFWEKGVVGVGGQSHSASTYRASPTATLLAFS